MDYPAFNGNNVHCFVGQPTKKKEMATTKNAQSIPISPTKGIRLLNKYLKAYKAQPVIPTGLNFWKKTITITNKNNRIRIIT